MTTHHRQVIADLVVKLRTDLTGLAGNVHWTRDIDASLDGIDLTTQTLPLMYLTGPSYVLNGAYRCHEKPLVGYGPDIPGSSPPVKSQFRKFSAEEPRDMLFGVVLISDNSIELLDLIDTVDAYFMNGKTVTTLRDPDNVTSPSNEYEVDLVDKFEVNKLVNLSNVKSAAARLQVLAVLFSDGQIFKEGFIADEAVLDTDTI